MEVYYVNHKNQKIDLGRPPYYMQIGDIFNYTNKYEGKNYKITRIYKDIITISTIITIEAPTEEDFCEAINHFFEVTETDNVACIQGRLFVGEYYLSCNILTSTKKPWKEPYSGLDDTVKILVPYPFWCREVTKSFLKNDESAPHENTGEFLYYPFGYPYRYSMPRNLAFLQNDHYAACDFKMIIYGPCTNPAIMINGHVYEVLTTLYTGDYLVIDSRDNKVIQYKNDGTTENKFNFRNKDSGLFEKIPNGRCSILWNIEAFGFDLTLFHERSVPKWIL